MPNAKPTLITDPQVIAEAEEMIWRTDTRQRARDANVAPIDVNRHVFLAWRVRRGGGVAVVVQGLGRMRPVEEP